MKKIEEKMIEASKRITHSGIGLPETLMPSYFACPQCDLEMLAHFRGNAESFLACYECNIECELNKDDFEMVLKKNGLKQ